METKQRLKEFLEIYEDSFAELAKFLGLSYQSLNKKLNNHVDFKRDEIKKIRERYNMNSEQMDFVFFQD